MEDWDLQAIVRGYTNQTIQYEKLDFDTFYDIPRTTTTTNLDDQFGDFHKFFPQTTLSTPTSMFALPDQEKNQQAAAKFQELQQGSLVALSSPVASSTVSASTPPRPKRRRSNEKIVVEELTAERLTLDIWAWRKYGQKPIKGSPYPRSYYRCSSSKGCPARRRVEQSSTNPNMFIVTYSAEHDHDKPTKRSSLAGTSRRKTNFNSQQQEEEDQVITNEPNNISSREVKEQVMSNINENCERLDISVIPNVIFRENLLPTLEEMAGISSEWRFEFDG